MPVGHKVWYYVKLTKIKNNKLMELLVFFLAILTVASIIGISMVAFAIAFKSLVKINELEQELIELKNKK
jgi:hypothetical protein